MLSNPNIVNLLQSLQSTLQTSTLLLESTEGIFFFLVRTVIFAKDTRSVRDFAHAQCHDTDLDTDVNTVHSLGTDPRTVHTRSFIQYKKICSIIHSSKRQTTIEVVAVLSILTRLSFPRTQSLFLRVACFERTRVSREKLSTFNNRSDSYVLRVLTICQKCGHF